MSDHTPLPLRAGHGAPAAADRRIRSIAIVGGGTAGWMAAAMMARALTGTATSLTVVESADIGTVGVGEATIPPIIDLLRFLSIDEADFIRHTQATYKLGIRFRDWYLPGHSYWHPFGSFGTPLDRRPFHHHVLRARGLGMPAGVVDYSLCAALGEAGRFRFPAAGAADAVGGLRYALHFDAALVAQYLRAYAERLGVVRLERTVSGATRRADGGIDELVFAGDTRLAADLYVDCSGFRGVLIEQALGTGFIDWSALLPCDRAVALPTAHAGPRAPYTQATARTAGWQWRIPLQHRVGNGYVYSSAHLSDAAALDDLLGEVGTAPLAEPRVLRFTAGRRRQFWSRNCVALGLASGFLEPLESTSIHLVMSGVYHLLDYFPDRDFDASNVAAYNAALTDELERIRDFIVLHYAATARVDAPLWRYCRTMALPDSLRERIELYRGTGRIRPRAHELFTDVSWFYIFDGLGVRPAAHDPLADRLPAAQLAQALDAIRVEVADEVRRAPSHDSQFEPAARGARGAVR